MVQHNYESHVMRMRDHTQWHCIARPALRLEQLFTDAIEPLDYLDIGLNGY